MSTFYEVAGTDGTDGGRLLLCYGIPAAKGCDWSRCQMCAVTYVAATPLRRESLPIPSGHAIILFRTVEHINEPALCARKSTAPVTAEPRGIRR